MKVILLAVITVDGFIAQSIEQSSIEWNSNEDRKFFSNLTKKIGTMIMGSRTFATINRALPGRKIVVLSDKERLVEFSDEEVVVENGNLKDVLAKLEQDGCKEVAVVGGSNVYTQFLTQQLVDELYLTIEPVMFGRGIKLLSTAVLQKLTLLEVIDLSSQTKVMHYKIVH